MGKRGPFSIWLVVVLTLSAGLLQAAEVDQHGKEHAWSGATGKVTVIDFAASWCAPCVKSLPRLEQLAKQHPSVRFLVVSVDKKRKGRDYLVEELGLELPVLWDENYRIAEHYRPEAMPSTVIIDRGGEEIYRHNGFTERLWQELVAKVAQLD